MGVPAMNIYPSGFYIYAYLREDGSPYYIGKGYKRRAYDKKHGVRIPKNKKFIYVMEQNLTELGALALERRYIRWYGRKDIGTGILRNRTDGGEGTSGFIRPEEANEKLRKAKTGKKRKPFSDEWKHKLGNSMRDKTHSEETRSKMSSSQKGRVFTDEHKKNMSLSRKGKPSKSKGKKRKPHTEETKLLIRKRHTTYVSCCGCRRRYDLGNFTKHQVINCFGGTTSPENMDT